jgi:hypothetical protein
MASALNHPLIRTLFLILLFSFPIISHGAVTEWNNGTSSINIFIDPDTDDYFVKMVNASGSGYATRKQYLHGTTENNITFSTDPAIYTTESLNTSMVDGKNLMIIYDDVDASNNSSINTHANGGSGNIEDYNGHSNFLALFYIDFDNTTDEIVCVGYNSDDACNDTLKTAEEEEETSTSPFIIVTDERLASSSCQLTSTSSDCEFFYELSTSTVSTTPYTADATPFNIFIFLTYFALTVLTFAYLTKRIL